MGIAAYFFSRLPAAACTLCNGCEMRGECVRVFLWCAACCDVSSLLQHGAHELWGGRKNNPWPLHTPVWNPHGATHQAHWFRWRRRRWWSRITSSPGGFFLFINPARLRLPLVIRVRAPPPSFFSDHHVGLCALGVYSCP